MTCDKTPCAQRTKALTARRATEASNFNMLGVRLCNCIKGLRFSCASVAFYSFSPQGGPVTYITSVVIVCWTRRLGVSVDLTSGAWSDTV